MLQIKNICKTYRTGGLTQRALDHVSLNLRDSEFVAILGQSGSGKTTLLNIIGGLDRYDEGDLIINGVSTKKYSDRDWDSYRNHTVGFVFQSYNLIPHQTVLANVELALTIGGISRKDRTSRAVEALKKVGLGDHIHKRPNQLSGGQMQRVAIARALVNDPDILLADEPTGALDSETSIQVMDLLQEVARDRLVVMVTHNPELAEQYATRIVNLRDGVILSDSDPFIPEITSPPAHKNMGKASMSPLTALLLSFNNLRTKLARTILVAFAGSIGIIGIAMILSMSTGADNYIKNTEEEALQGYPLQITDTSIDMTAMMTGGRDQEEAVSAAESAQDQVVAEEEPQVRELKMLSGMFSQVSSNDLGSLKTYLESEDSGVQAYVRSIEYTYGITPQIFALRDGEVRQVNPDSSFRAMGFTRATTSNSLMSAFTSTDTFHAMPEDEDLYVNQYEVKAGRWPEAYNECVVVLSSSGGIMDMTLYTLGLKDPKTLDEMVKTFMEGGTPEVDENVDTYAYEDFLGIEFKLVPASAYYVYDKEYKVWTDKTDNKKYMKKLVKNAEPLTVVGVVQPLEDATAPVLTRGIGYPASLTTYVMETAADSEIVQAQMEDRDVDVFTNLKFGEERKEDLDMSTLFDVDENAMADAFQFDEDSMKMEDLDLSDLDFSDVDLGEMDMGNLDLGSMDLSSAFSSGDFSGSMPTISQEDMASLLSGVKIDVSSEDMRDLFETLLSSFLDYAQDDPATNYRALPEAVGDFLGSDELRQVLVADMQAFLQENSQELISRETLEALVSDILEGYPAYAARRMAEDQALARQPVTPSSEEEAIIDPPNPLDYLPDYLDTPEVQQKIDAGVAAMQQSLQNITITPEQSQKLLTDLQASYTVYSQKNQLPDPTKMGDAFQAYLQTPEAQEIIGQAVAEAVDTTELERRATDMVASFTSALGQQIGAALEQAIPAMAGQVMSAVMEQAGQTLAETISEALSEKMEEFTKGLTDRFADAFQVDPEAIAAAVSTNMDENRLRELLTSLMGQEESSYDSNLTKLGYALEDDPSSITIYPMDFDSKTRVKEILAEYNDMQRAAGEEDKVITYTDMVDALMGSVTDIVNAISYVLVAFVSISLVVSSIMIGVITYISVLERNKEIGILRAIGASKRNISQVFNAETFIIGGLAGIFGVVITWLLLFPVNHILRSLTGQANLAAVLPARAALLLILLSVVLTLIGGIIPSQKAARSDPVAALRSE